MESYDHGPPKLGVLQLAKAPRPRELYWARFPNDAEQPEFWKERPVVVLSSQASLSSTVFVVPCTSVTQEGNRWAVALSASIDGGASWAICDKPTSLAVTRLRAQKNKPRVTEDDFALILRRVYSLIPMTSLSDARRAEIERRLLKRHLDVLSHEENSSMVLNTILNLLKEVRD